MNDIEDFITTKNNLGPDDYNNFDASLWDIQACKRIFVNLLLWLNENKVSLNVANNNDLTKKFEPLLNKQMRLSRIKNIRKSILLNIIHKSSFCVCYAKLIYKFSSLIVTKDSNKFFWYNKLF